MCVKLPPRDLNLDPCLAHPTSICTCGAITALRVCGGKYRSVLSLEKIRSVFNENTDQFWVLEKNQICI